MRIAMGEGVSAADYIVMQQRRLDELQHSVQNLCESRSPRAGAALPLLRGIQPLLEIPPELMVGPQLRGSGDMGADLDPDIRRARAPWDSKNISSSLG